MNCEQFRRAYHKFDGATNVIHWKDVETPEYADYSDHMQDCPACRDWYQAEQVALRDLNPELYPCIHMAYHVTHQCETHQDPWECPGYLVVHIEQFDEFGIPIRDGGTSYWKIDHCPWCGVALPESKRDLWLRKIMVMGLDPFKDYDRIPEEYKTSRWFRSRSHLTLLEAPSIGESVEEPQ